MKTKSTCEPGFSVVASLGNKVEESGDFTCFLRVRRELNQFLLNLNHSNHAEGKGQQIHFLFLALEHLENVDREIRISSIDDELLSAGRVCDRVRSLKLLILKYIRQLSGESFSQEGT